MKFKTKRKIISVIMIVLVMAAGMMTGIVPGTSITSKAESTTEAVPVTIKEWSAEKGELVVSCYSDQYEQNLVEGQQYVIALADEAPDWTDPLELDKNGLVTFSNLKLATEYVIWSRVKADTTKITQYTYVTELLGMGCGDEMVAGNTITAVPDPEDVKGLIYQWFVAVEHENEEGSLEYDLTPIEGATTASLKLTEDMVGKMLQVNAYIKNDKDKLVCDNVSFGPVHLKSEWTQKPVAKELTYTGTAQALVTPGSAEGCTIYYALGNDAVNEPDFESYSTTIPTATETGTYYVWFNGEGDSTHSMLASECVKVVIGKKADEKITDKKGENPGATHPQTSGADEQKPAAKEDRLQKIYEKLTRADSDYSKLKETYKDFATLSEKYENGVITISSVAKSSDYETMNGSWTFTLDGDYVVHTSKTSDLAGYPFVLSVCEAVSEYLGMDYDLVFGYMTVVETKNLKSDYFSITKDAAADTTTYKFYTAGQYDMSLINDVYLDEDFLTIIDGPLSTGSNYYLINGGKLSATMNGSVDDYTIVMAEYGDSTELSRKSLIELVKKLKPLGYEDFVKNYTKLEKASSDYYKVSFLTNTEEIKELAGEARPQYKYVKVVFKPQLTVKPGMAKKLAFNNIKVKKWSTSKKSVVTVSKGKITALKKGKATITATLKDGSQITYTVKVSGSPVLVVGGKKYKKSTTYTVKKNGTLKVKITGKAASVKNVYTSADLAVAKVTSKASASTVKIKGLKAGSTTVTIKVNEVKYKIRVKVR